MVVAWTCMKQLSCWDLIYKHLQNHSKPLKYTVCEYRTDRQLSMKSEMEKEQVPYSCFSPTWPFVWQRLLASMLVSLDNKQSDWKEKLVWGNVGELTMVLCIVLGCGSKSGKNKGLGLLRIPKIITDWGKEYEELTRKRRERWISAVSCGDIAEKNILETERVCSRNFHQEQPAKDFDQFNPDWVPSLNLGKPKNIDLQRTFKLL